ncbi:MAG: alanine racemase [Actinobacteria bacterium]|nr:alanine racemase [Actinomycetota bacterium]
MKSESGIYRPLEAKIDLDAIRHNVAFLKNKLSEGCRFMAVVKANAYGHGDVEVSQAALEAGADCLGVALLEEAVKLRQAGFTCPVHLLFEPPPGTADAAVKNEIVCTVYTREYALALSEAAAENGVIARVHIKIDSGMHRVGVDPSDFESFCLYMKDLPALSVDGIYTHLAVASEPSDSFTEIQLDKFDRASREAEEIFGRDLVKHAANSSGILAFPGSHYDMVRAGIAMYGLFPSPELSGFTELKPALSLVGEVAYVKRVREGEGISYGLKYRPPRDTYIATIPVGYADGYSRILTGCAEVLLDGVRLPIVGAVCMDLCMVDLGEHEAEKGAPFVLIGKDGDEEITADEIAGKLGTINYEVICMISSRVPRRYIGKS